MAAIRPTVPFSEAVAMNIWPRSNGVLSAAIDAETVQRIRAAKPFRRWLAAELRSDHAGEVGAVEIYRGALAANRDPKLRQDILRHLETERCHLLAFQRILEPKETSRVLYLWKLAGWFLGYIACRAGPNTYHRTIASVETFVDSHYEQQIRRLTAENGDRNLLALLLACQRDEAEHRDEAARRVTGEGGLAGRLWGAIVGAGSAAAVALARRM